MYSLLNGCVKCVQDLAAIRDIRVKNLRKAVLEGTLPACSKLLDDGIDTVTQSVRKYTKKNLVRDKGDNKCSS